MIEEAHEKEDTYKNVKVQRFCKWEICREKL